MKFFLQLSNFFLQPFTAQCAILVQCLGLRSRVRTAFIEMNGMCVMCVVYCVRPLGTVWSKAYLPYLSLVDESSVEASSVFEGRAS